MRLSIRWKLICAIAVPLLVIYAIIGTRSYHVAYDRALDDRRALAGALATLYTARFDGQLRQVAQVAASTAAYLSTHAELPPRDLYQLLRANLEQHPLIYGSSIAFEPGTYEPNRQLFAPYAYRDGDGVAFLDIGRDAYDYTADWEWYTAVRESQTARWTEPYFDEGAGDILMCTYSAPFFDAAGTFRGVVTVDIPLEQLQDFVDYGELAGGSFLIFSEQGRFIAAPDPSLIMRRVQDDDVVAQAAALDAITNEIERRATGFMRLNGFPQPGPQWVYLKPMRSAGWMFAAVFPESVVLAPVYQRMTRQAKMMLLEFVVVLAALFAVGWWITAPISRLAQAVRALEAGDLHAKVTGVQRSDELGDLARAYNRMIDQLDHHVQALADEKAARESAEHELRTARQIQALLLPRSLSPFPDRAAFDLHAVCQPAQQMAGDFFDYFFIDGNLLGIVMANVAGKGVPAALFMAVTRTIMRNLLSSEPLPASVLARANELLFADNHQHAAVSMFCAVYDTRGGHMLYANAGYEPPVIVKPGSGVSRLVINGDEPVLGINPGEVWEQHTLKFMPGDKLALHNARLTQLLGGEAALFHLLTEHAALEPDHLCQLMQREAAQRNPAGDADGLMLLILRQN